MVLTYTRLPAALTQELVLTFILSLYLPLLFIEVNILAVN